MDDSLFQDTNPYDLLAELISHLRALDEKLFLSVDARKALVDDGRWTQAAESFFQQHPELNDADSLLSCGIPRELVSAIHQWEHYQEFPYVLHLLIKLESSFHWNKIIHNPPIAAVERQWAKKDSPYAFHLNGNVTETGILIFLRVPSINETDTPADENPPSQKSWLTDWAPGINQELKNTYFVDQRDLVVRGKQYRVRHRVLDKMSVKNKRYLRIAVSPLLKDAMLDSHFCEKEQDGKKQNFFSVKGISNSARVHDRVRAAFMRACENDADILVFPEMLGDEELLEPDSSFSHMLDQFGQEARDRGWAAPYLTLAPTWWHEGQNELHLFLHTSDRLAVQQKQHPYLHEIEADGNASSADAPADAPKKAGGQPPPPGHYLEDLRDPLPEILLLHIPGLGRVAFPICKDFLMDDYQNLLVRTLRTTISICPSFSSAKTLFSLSGSAHIAYGCYTIWLNTCSAYNMFGKPIPGQIGFVSCPQTEGAMQMLCPSCGGACGKDSDACLFVVDLSLDRARPGVTIHDHIRPEAAS